MANLCDFEMIIKGEKNNIDEFLKALQQDNDYCIGRGATIDGRADDENETRVCGWCKWSIMASLVIDAHTMQEQKETGKGMWANENGFIDNHEFLDIVEASGKWNLEIEIVSWECDMCFSEHYLFDNGNVVINDCCEYEEVYNEDTDEYDFSGGFEHLF